MSTYSDHTRSRGLSTVFTVAGQVRAYLSSAIVLALVSGWLLSLALPTYAQGPNQIGLVIHHGDGSATTRCVEFSEPQLSGYDVLQRSQLDLSVDASGMGGAICRIDGEGCTTPQEDCFCGMNQNPPVYWSYWQVVDGQWRYSNLGASMSVVQPGAVEAWVWGPGNADETAPLPMYSLEQICAPATPTATHTATITPLPTLTFTPEPTATLPPAATDTPWPTNTPTEIPTEIPTATPTATFTPSDTPWPTETPTWTPSATLEPPMTPSPTLTWTPVPPTAMPTEMPSAPEESVAMAAQPEAAVSYGLRLPVVQAPALATADIGVTNINTALPTTMIEPTIKPMIEPTAPPLPTATPEVVAIVATEPLSTPVPEVVTVVVTPPPVATIVIVEEVTEVATVAEVAIAPTLLPAAAPPAPALDTQVTMLLGIIAAAGMLVALPMGLVLVAVVAYWVGRRL